jgi:hypothetical protein
MNTIEVSGVFGSVEEVKRAWTNREHWTFKGRLVSREFLEALADKTDSQIICRFDCGTCYTVLRGVPGIRFY